MPDYEVGSEYWYYDLYNQFLSGGDMQPEFSGQGLPGGAPGLPSVYDWASASGDDPDAHVIGYQDVTGNIDMDWDHSFVPGSNAWSYQFNDPASGYAGVSAEIFQDNNQWTSQGQHMPILFNLDQWLADWAHYMPQMNTQDIADAKTIGAAARSKSIYDTMQSWLKERSSIDSYLTGSNEKLDALYEASLASGRLSDFKTSANLYDLETGFLAEAYGAAGDIAGMGAFDWGNINESDYFITTSDPGGSSSSDETSAYCDNVCFDMCQDPDNMDDCNECFNYCLSSGDAGTFG